jgi:peptide/nickel transport system substrate-binding protein
MQSMTNAFTPESRALGRRSFLRMAALVGMGTAVAGSLASCAPATATATILRIGSTTDIDSLNPFTAFSTQALDVLQLVYDKLMDYDSSLKVTPSLATLETKSADGATFTYTLRDDAKWHDGKPVTVDDVVFTFLMVRDNNYGSYGAYLTELTAVEKLSSNTVRLSYSAPQTLEPGVIIPIVPKHIWSLINKKDLPKYSNSKAVGSGPFRYTSWKKGSLATVTRNDSWWGAKPAASQVTWAVFGSDDIVTQALKTGAIDIVAEVPPTIYKNLKGAKNVRSVEMDSFSFHMIGFNCSQKAGSKGSQLLKDQVVRQALSLAISRKQLVELALNGFGQPGTDLLPPAFGDYHYTPSGNDVLDDDPTRAIRLLEAAGYTDPTGAGVRTAKDGSKLAFRILAISDTAVDVRAAQLVVTAARAVGIQLTLSTTDANTMGSTVYNTDTPDWDIMVWGWDASLYDPSYLLGIPTTDQLGGNNDTFWTDSQYDALYAEQARTIDTARRVALVQQMQKIHYESCPYIVMWYQKKLTGLRTDTWAGWAAESGGMILNFSRANYLDVKSA